MEIITLEPRQKQKAAEVIAAAFFDYPMFTFYFPNPSSRMHLLRWYLGNVLNCALRYGEVCATKDFSGVLFTLPPGHTRISQWEYIRNGFLLTPIVLGQYNFVRSQICEKFVGDTHEKIMQDELHYYLWGLAVEPGHKRGGVGTALMQPLLAKADAEKMPIYLETHNEKNVAYYERFGFTLTHTDAIPRYELPIWCMVRQPAG
jgi:ribosomal protein S18 acetylase RimI-like enzyme